MSKLKKVFVCQSCNHQAAQWLGKCPECSAWNSFQEDIIESAGAKKNNLLQFSDTAAKMNNLQDIEVQSLVRTSSNIIELDRVLGGGLVQGSVVLIGGEPGIGKSTIMMQLAQNISRSAVVIYISAEENPQQIQMRAQRLKIDSKSIIIYPESCVDVSLTEIRKLARSSSSQFVIIVDSIQTVYTNDTEGVAGSVSQVKESAAKIVNFSKNTQIPVIIVGHVTKDGAIAGPKLLEHLVDTVVYLEGERYSELRIMRAVKNRFGPVNEVGLFEMTNEGLIEISDPSKILMDRNANYPGAVDTIILEGVRPMPIEIQALVTKSYIPVPRRVSQGIDNSRLQLLVAIISKKLKIPMHEQDIFVNVVGGISLRETSSDLAIVMAILSSYFESIVPPSVVAYGEVGLLGEIRQSSKEKIRESEAQNRGYSHIISSQKYQDIKTLSREFFQKTH